MTLSEQLELHLHIQAIQFVLYLLVKETNANLYSPYRSQEMLTPLLIETIRQRIQFYLK